MTTLIKSISLRMKEYGDDKGTLLGEIEFLNQHGEIKVRLNNDQSEKIVAILAEELVATAKQTAMLMTTEVLTHAAGGATLLEA